MIPGLGSAPSARTMGAVGVAFFPRTEALMGVFFADKGHRKCSGRMTLQKESRGHFCSRWVFNFPRLGEMTASR